MPKYSIVIPLHNEEENVTDLYDRLKAVMETNGESFEMVLVDDGSSDETFHLLRQIAGVDSRVTVVCLRRNFGQTSALAVSGIRPCPLHNFRNRGRKPKVKANCRGVERQVSR